MGLQYKCYSVSPLPSPPPYMHPPPLLLPSSPLLSLLHFIHSFTHSFSKHLLRASSVLGTGTIADIKASKVSALTSLG